MLLACNKILDKLLFGFIYGISRSQLRFSANFNQILAVSGPLLLMVSVGATIGFPAILLPQLQDPRSSIPLDSESTSWLAPIAILAMIPAGFSGGFLMKQFGCKFTHVLGGIVGITGWLIIALSPTSNMILLGRFVTGISTGLICPVITVYIGETAAPDQRGFLLSTISCTISIGIFVVQLIGTFYSWRFVAYASCLITSLGLLVMALAPESPLWLLRNDKIQEAQTVFVWCRGFSDQAKDEMAAILERQVNATKLTFREKFGLLGRVEFVKPLVITSILMLIYQWSGVNAISSYTVGTMKLALGDGMDEYLGMSIVNSIRVISSIIGCLIIDRIGRRPLLMTSGFSTTVCLLVLSGYHHFIGDNNKDLAMVSLAAFLAFIFFTSIGLVILPLAMVGELFPHTSRDVGSSVSMGVNFIAFYLVVHLYPMMMGELGLDVIFFIYGMVVLLGTVLLFVLLPETKNRMLHEIEDGFKERRSCIVR